MVIHGYVAALGDEGPVRGSQNVFVNRRIVKDRTIAHAITEAYSVATIKERSPEVHLFVQIPPDRVDVNVHPTKAEVRFLEQSARPRGAASGAWRGAWSGTGAGAPVHAVCAASRRAAADEYSGRARRRLGRQPMGSSIIRSDARRSMLPPGAQRGVNVRLQAKPRPARRGPRRSGR